MADTWRDRRGPLAPFSHRRFRTPALLVGVAALTVGVLPPALAAQKPSAKVTRAGCSTTRTATAYSAAGQPDGHQPPDRPVPCLVAPGYTTIENHIGVTNTGTLVFEPAIVTPGLLGTTYLPGAPGPHPYNPLSHAGIAVSASQGATWDFVKPGGALYAPNDNSEYVDPATGRIFLEMLSADAPTGGQVPLQDQGIAGKALMLTSGDDGRTWGYTALTGFVLPENARFTAAPPAPGQATTAGGYPDVTYWCGNQNVGLTSPVILDRQCFRSLDAGATWEQRSILFTNAGPASPECGNNPASYSATDGYYPEGAPDGSLYVMVACSGQGPGSSAGPVYLARSTDEAATWPVLEQPGGASASDSPVALPLPAGAASPELRVTAVEGHTVLVLTYQATVGGGPAVAVRTAVVPAFGPGGALSQPLAWSAPARLTPSGLSSIDRWSVEVRGSELALSYIAGTPSGSATVYDGYLTMTPDVTTLAAIWTAMVNDPSSPLSTTAPQSARDDFIGVAIGPDGTPWASYFAPCSADPQAPTDPACEGAYFDGQPVNGDIQGGNDRSLVASLYLR